MLTPGELLIAAIAFGIFVSRRGGKQAMRNSARALNDFWRDVQEGAPTAPPADPQQLNHPAATGQHLHAQMPPPQHFYPPPPAADGTVRPQYYPPPPPDAATLHQQHPAAPLYPTPYAQQPPAYYQAAPGVPYAQPYYPQPPYAAHPPPVDHQQHDRSRLVEAVPTATVPTATVVPSATTPSGQPGDRLQ